MSMQSDGFGPNPNLPPQGSSGSSSALKWVLGILAALALLTVLCCGGCFLVMKFGLDQVGVQVTQQIKDDPVIVEHIGTIESVDVDMFGTSEYQQETGDSDVMVFTIQGDKGSGVLRGGKTGPNQMGGFVLEKDGQEYPLSE